MRKRVKEYQSYDGGYGSTLFEASEAYKLLRTNLSFLLGKKEECRVLGVTSSVRGEGKSTTAMNLALSFAEENKRVLLVELDMRLPTLANNLNIAKTPGFSNIIAGADIDDAIQKVCLNENLNVITAGSIPPNPAEILSSYYMEVIFEKLKELYDYIIVDLPPINVVSDALSVSRFLDGIMMVVRENYSRKRELNEALRRLEMVGAKMLGFIVNDNQSDEGKYGKNYKYKYKYGYNSYK